MVAIISNTLLRRIEQKLDRLMKEARAFRREDRIGDEKMSKETQAAIDELKGEVSQNTDATASVVQVIDGLVARLEEAGDDPDEIREVIAAMKSNREALAAAAMKGTPIEPSGN